MAERPSDYEQKMARFLELEETSKEGRKETFERYARCLGFTKSQLYNKEILDVGASSAGFADYTREAGIPCRVDSIDSAELMSISGVEQGNNRKFPKTAFEDLDLKEFGLDEEPQYDLIFSSSSTPYTLVNEAYDAEGNFKEKDKAAWLEKIRTSIQKVIASTASHLKPGKKEEPSVAVFFPVYGMKELEKWDEKKQGKFKAVIPFAQGGPRDFTEWTQILKEETDRFKKDPENFMAEMGYEQKKYGEFDVQFVDVEVRGDYPPAQRMLIIRLPDRG